ncbi:hypothetical protein [Streptomyces calvus]|nr:hypothetical protein [Streptomyces calvus]
MAVATPRVIAVAGPGEGAGRRAAPRRDVIAVATPRVIAIAMPRRDPGRRAGRVPVATLERDRGRHAEA